MDLCQRCGQPIPPDAPGGACPRCSLNLAFGAFQPGTTLGPYELLERIGQGAMGRVYRARHRALGREVALKTIGRGQFASESEVRRFQREAQLVASLTHPNIVPIHEVGEDGGHHFLAMELVEGQSLAELGPLEPMRAARYVAQLAGAMSCVHGKGVIHRDLKPSNVIIDRQDRARVIDFGLGLLVSADSSLTGSGQALGTPSYMPPEQARGEAAGPAADVYALGAILYELLTGRPPFRGDSPLETLRQVIDDEPVAPRVRTPGVPKELELVALKCLAKQPAQRYASAAELEAELQRFLSGDTIQTRAARGPGRWLRRNVAWLSGYAVVVGVGLVVRQQLLEANLYSARHAASSILLDFRNWSAPLIAAAQSAELRHVLRENDKDGAARVVTDLHRRLGGAQSLILATGACIGLARDPPKADIIGVDLSMRDYCRGAREVAGVYVPKVHLSQYDVLVRHGLSIAVRESWSARQDADSGGELLGVLVMTLATDAFDEKVVVVAPWDTGWRPGDVPIFVPGTRWVILMHPGYAHADRYPVAFDGEPNEGARSYFDPMSRRSVRWAGPWLAGVAPVGDTGYRVVVQTRDGVGLGLVAMTVAFAVALTLRSRTRHSAPR